MMKKRRKEVGMTQRRLAKMCKMSQPAIANIESGASSPNWDTIVKIPEALGPAIKFHNR
ncbi:MAG: helix-turn-helix domain-containing protein [Bacilli bacterium]|nr:helix-turn-helix domain-containing protein [Bacilli bacterium]